MFRNFFGLPTNVPNSARNDWADIQYRFTRNIPRNVQDEAEPASKLEGIVSKESQLSVLSIIDNPTKEIERMDKEGDMSVYDTDEKEHSVKNAPS